MNIREDNTNYEKLDDLLDAYKDSEPGYINFGPTCAGIDCWFLSADVNNVFIAVENIGDTGQTLVAIQGNASLRVGRFLSIKGCLIGEPEDMRDEIEVFDKAKDKGGYRNLNSSDCFAYDSTPNTILEDAKKNQGLYYLYDGDELIDTQYVMSVVGVGELDWLEKIGLPKVDLQIALSLQMNTFEDSYAVLGGFKITLENKPAFTGIVSVGFVKGELDSFGFSIKGEIPLGGVTLTAVGFNLSGMAGSEPNVIAAELGLAFGKKVELPSLIAKMLDTSDKFFVWEIIGGGEVATDFKNVNISVQANVLGFIEAIGHYRYINGYYHEAGISVGTVKSSLFRFRVEGDVGWSKDSLSIKVSLEGNFKFDFTVKAFGTNWEFAALDVGGGISFDYNSQDKKISTGVVRNDASLCISVNGHANVKILFAKFGVQVNKNWFIEYDPEYSYSTDVRSVIPATSEAEYIECENLQLQSLTREELSTMPTLPEMTRAGSDARYDETIGTDEFPRELLEEMCLELSEDGAGKSIEIMVAAQYTLNDCYWEIVTNGAIYTSKDDLSTTPVTFTQVSHSQYQLSIANPQAGPWILDVYGSKEWNGAILLNAELGNPIETSLSIDDFGTVKKEVVFYEYDDAGNIKTDEEGHQVIKDSYFGNVTQATVTYQAHAGDADALVLLCMEEAGSQEHNGVVVSVLDTTAGDDTKTVTVEIPYDIQGGEYAFYIKAMASDWNGASFSQYSDVFKVVPQTAKLVADNLEIAMNASTPNRYTANFTLTNDGSENASDAHVELVFTTPGYDEPRVLIEDTVSLGAGESREMSFSVLLPDDVDSARGKLTLRIDAEDAIEEGIFDGDAETSQYVSTARILDAGADDIPGATALSWDAVAGAVSYTLKYALNQDWENSVAIEGLTDTSVALLLAPGRYLYTVLAVDEEGNEFGSGKDFGKFDVASIDNLKFLQVGDEIRTEDVFLYDGIYSLENVNLGSFTGTLTLQRVYGNDHDNDDVILSMDVTNGEIASNTPFALENGQYFLAATLPQVRAVERAAFSVTLNGTLIVDNNSQRNSCCITSALDDKGEFFELVSSSIGANAPDDIWDYSLSQGGQLTLSVMTEQAMTTALTFNLYVMDENGDYALNQSFTVEEEGDIILLNRYSILNNFYIEVTAADETELLMHTDYSMSVFFDAFHADVNDETIMDTDDEGSLQVSGWVGYADESDTFLLTIGENDGGVYSLTLEGDTATAALNVYSTSGELLANAAILENGVASIEGMTLYAGNYFIEIASQDEGQGGCNTDFRLSVMPEEIFSYVDEHNTFCIDAEPEKFLMALYITEDGQYDISQVISTHNARVYEALNTGELKELQVQDGVVELLKDCTYYLDVNYLNRSGIVSLDTLGKILSWDNFITVVAEEATGTGQTLRWSNAIGENGETLVISLPDNQYAFKMPFGIAKVNVLGLAEDAKCSVITTERGNEFYSDEMALVATNVENDALLLQGNADGANVFFATVKGTWESGYSARHDTMGFLVPLEGKNKVIDIFDGTGANNIVILGDDENGDALFVDDIYSDSPDDMAKIQSRLANLTEIYAGAGDDVVDMTSARFAYEGAGLTIHGGSGNDVIWVNHGDNCLYGDEGDDMLVGAEGNDLLVGGEGDDTIFGGGGADVCVFSGNWGHDSVVQVAEGSLTLCFEEGDEAYWNPGGLRYDDGVNSLEVSGGVPIDKITVVFGDEKTKAFLGAPGCLKC